MTEKPTLQGMSKPWMNIFALSGSSDSKVASKAFGKICRVPEKAHVQAMHPQYDLQMKPLKTWWELNGDYSVWIIIV